MKINSAVKFEDNINWDEELRGWLENYIIQYPNHTTEVLSRSQYTGIPQGALDSYLAGLYFLPKAMGGEGNNPKKSKLETSIREYQRKVGGTIQQGYGKPFFQTKVWTLMSNALRIALDENAIVVVYGKPGIGKSKTLTEFALREMKRPPLNILCSRNITTGYFVKYIAEKLRVKKSGSIAEIENSISDRLEKHPYPLFADQANFLPERALGSICHFWERAKIPIALVGTYELYEKFMKSSVTEDVRAQLVSRIAVHYPLPELEIEELKGVVQYHLGTEVTDDIIAEIYNKTGGIYRNVEMLIARIKDLKTKNFAMLNSAEIDLHEIIDVAASRLMLYKIE